MGLMLGQKLLGHDIDHMAVNTEDDYQEIIGEHEKKRDKYVFTPPPAHGATARESEG
jgi:hypothetical protein